MSWYSDQLFIITVGTLCIYIGSIALHLLDYKPTIHFINQIAIITFLPYYILSMTTCIRQLLTQEFTILVSVS